MKEINEATLERLYVAEQKSITDIQKETGITLSTIRRRLKEFGLLRGRADAIRLAAKQNKMGGGLRGKKRQLSDEWKKNIGDAIRRKWEGHEKKPASRVLVTCCICGSENDRAKKSIASTLRKRGKYTCKKCSTKSLIEKNRSQIGATRKTPSGYIMEKSADGWIQQHRLVMERHIGRKLLISEVVHHIDHNRINNAIENLEIDSNGEHTRKHHNGSKRDGVALKNIREGAARRSTTKLNYELVAEARARVSNGETQASIAQSFQVSQMTICRAVRGESWNHGNQ